MKDEAVTEDQFIQVPRAAEAGEKPLTQATASSRMGLICAASPDSLPSAEGAPPGEEHRYEVHEPPLLSYT
jgi:hypothetical protein